MTTDPFRDLDAIRRFLHEDVLPDVTPAISGELRAAIKVLGAVTAELESLHPRTLRECCELQQLCGELATALDAPGQSAAALPEAASPDPGFESTTDMLRFHAELSTLLGSLLERAETRRDDSPGAARTTLDALLHRCYATLGRHAARASRWQNVFERVAPDENEPD